jgi:hypothetical protein
MTSSAIQARTDDSRTHASGSAAPLAAQRDRRFFSGFALVLLLTVIAGFSRTYYFNELSTSPFELTPALHWHGAAFTGWMLLLVTQTLLIASGNARLHRRLGVAGAVLAAVMVVLGIYIAVSRTADGTMLDRGVPPLSFMAVPVVGMLVFGGLVAAALLLRRQAASHKRLMMLATLELVTAGISRVPVVDSWGPPGFFGVTDLFILAIVAYDLLTLRRVHRATLWGGLFLFLSQPARLLLGDTSMWLGLAGWLTTQ